MAYISNITINGQSAQFVAGMTAPVVGGLLPLVQWQYVNDPGDAGQDRFDLRIGSTITDWGTDDFVGDIASLDETSTTNYYQHDQNDLARSATYYGQIQARDTENDKTAWAIFTFTINQLPFVTGYTLTPESPTSAQDVELDYVFHDADGHNQAGTVIRWYKNGVYQPRYDNLCILPSSATSGGESWYAKIIPSDGLEFGPTVETDAVTISSIDEIFESDLIENVTILPIDPNVDDILKVEYDLVDTEYIPIEDEVVIQWYVNNTLISDSDQQYIRLDLDPGDEVQVRVKLVGADDGSDLASTSSEIKIVEDVPWYAYNVFLSGQKNDRNLPDTEPIVNFSIHKTTAERGQKPNYVRVMVTRNESIGGAIYDSGFVEYKTNSYLMPSGVMEEGKAYYVHVGVSDSTEIDDESRYGSTFVRISGSSWESNVSNSTGWTIEFKMSVEVQGTDSPFTNPYDVGEFPSKHAIFETALAKWDLNFLGENEDGLAFVLLGPENAGAEGVETATAGGFTIKRIYDPSYAIYPPDETSPTVTYDGYFSSTASNPYVVDTTNYNLWKECKAAYDAMNISKRREEVSGGGSIDLQIHDGTYYAALRFGARSVTFVSQDALTYTLPSTDPGLVEPRVFRVEAQNNNLWLYINNILVMEVLGQFNSPSLIRRLELGDFNPSVESSMTLEFFRYTTDGMRGLDDEINPPDTFYFKRIAQLQNGQVEYVTNDRLIWTPNDTDESSKIYEWNPDAPRYHLQTVNRNYSPVTAIHVDKQRNKYIGTANGVTAIYGEKHDTDYLFDTTGSLTSIPQEDFDRITNVSSDRLAFVTQNRIANWFSIDTTYRSIGEISLADEYEPYGATQYLSHAIHYYSQRTHGHSWFDNVDNTKGWQASFSFALESLEADGPDNSDIDHHGFGIYVNDGTRQEVIYFYQDRIRLYHANVYVGLDTTRRRDYVITGQSDNLKIYQKLTTSAVGSYQLVLDGTGLFTTEATRSGNSRKPKIVLGNDGNYHAVWHDDGNRRSKIMYSYHDGQSWSHPELVTESTQFDLRNPVLDTDSSGRVWVAYEDTSWGPTEISVSVRDTVGWNPKVRVTNSPSEKRHPDIKVDPIDDVHVVWEDNRNGHWDIFWTWWQNLYQAWNSSGQFGEDVPIVQYDDQDPYLGNPVEHHNPKLCLDYPRLWVVYEAHDQEDNQSVIYHGYRDLESNYWASAGAVKVEDGEGVGTGQSFAVSDYGRYAVNPSVTSITYNSLGHIVIAWEDKTEPISQVWGRAYTSGTDHPITDAEALTTGTTDSSLPSVGGAGNHFVVAYERSNVLYGQMFNSATRSFGTEHSLAITSKQCSNVALPPSSTREFVLVYNFKTPRDSSDLSTVEWPDFYLIGDASVTHNNGDTITITDNSMVSSLDTKEFAFGDLSEMVGMIAHWRDIGFYYGYDAIPHQIIQYNTDTVPTWPDNRIFDIFVDVYGNIIAGTYGGLIYYNVFTQKSVTIPDFIDKRVDSVLWSKGTWYVGTSGSTWKSIDAGQSWSIAMSGGYRLASNDTYVVSAAADSIVYVQKHGETTSFSLDISNSSLDRSVEITSVAIDEANVIWIGTHSGIVRIENLSLENIMLFTNQNGMRSSYVHDIAIVNKHLRYLATATGVERMYGSKFVNFNVRTHEILNNNVYRIKYYESTKSLWVGTMYQLTEIVFRDPAHEIIQDEIVHYGTTEIATENLVDRDLYYMLDVPIDEETGLPPTTAPESSLVYINKNKIEFGYTVNEAESVSFECDLLINDEVEVEISNLFKLIHDFNQLGFEAQIEGDKRTIIYKTLKTSTGKDFYLAGGDRSELLLDGNVSQVPFATIMMDVDRPFGCIEKLETLSRREIRFKIVAFDEHSGVESYMLSNNPEFVESDGVTPLEWQPIKSSVVHDLGEGLDNVITSYTFPSTVTIAGETYNVGTGSHIGIWTDETTGKDYIIALTSSPIVAFKYDDAELEWNAIDALDPDDETRKVTTMKTIGTTIYVTTESTKAGARGDLRRMTNGTTFDNLVEISDSAARGIAEWDGTILFGSGDGKIYSFLPKTSQHILAFENIGDSIYALDVYENTLWVGAAKERVAGTQGHLYSIDLETGNNLPEFVKSGTAFEDLVIHSTGEQPSEAYAFVAATDLTEIYKGNMQDRVFRKDYASFGASVNRVRIGDISVVDSELDPGTEAVLTAIGPTILYYANPTWEYVHRHSGDINDLVEFTANELHSIWYIDDTTITRWNQVTGDSKKTVYLRLKDKVGNVSIIDDLNEDCPVLNEETGEYEGCCQAYSISIKDLQEFINESRLIDITSTGEVVYAYDSPTGVPIYSADRIDYEEGSYVSEIFNGSTNLVSWKSITWVSTEPEGTSVHVQVRTAASEELIPEQDWSLNLEPNPDGIVSLEYLTNQYLQFRITMRSEVRNASPTLTSVTIRNITTQSSHFFTTNFVLPTRPIKGLLTANTFIPVSADIVFGITTKNSTDFADYQVIDINRLFTTTQAQFEPNLRVGARLLAPSVAFASDESDDPYETAAYSCTILFDYDNIDSTSHDYHFRVKFYNDPGRTQLIYTFFSGNDQTGWAVDGGASDIFPATGVTISAGDSKTISFTPVGQVEDNQRWYIAVDAYNGTSFENISSDRSYVCATCNLRNEEMLIGEYYQTGLPTLTTMPTFSKFTPDHVVLETHIDFPPTGGTAWVTTGGTLLEGYTENFAVRFRGRVHTPSTGQYTFYLSSDDGSRLYIDGIEVIDNDGVQLVTEKSGNITLGQGFHDIEVHYFQAQQDATLRLEWVIPGTTTRAVVPPDKLYHTVVSEYCEETTAPRIFNFAVLFELENGETVKLNLT